MYLNLNITRKHNNSQRNKLKSICISIYKNIFWSIYTRICICLFFWNIFPFVIIFAPKKSSNTYLWVMETMRTMVCGRIGQRQWRERGPRSRTRSRTTFARWSGTCWTRSVSWARGCRRIRSMSSLICWTGRSVWPRWRDARAGLCTGRIRAAVGAVVRMWGWF